MKKFIIITSLLLIIASLLKAQDSLVYITRIAGDNEEAYFHRVTNTGDVNGDGFGDFLVGAGGGYAKLFLGGKEINPEGDYYFSITEDDDDTPAYFGSAVAGGGDLNGDGYDDFAISWPGYDNISNEGRIYIYFGGEVVDTIPDLIIEREFDYWNHPNFSYHIVMDGDINSDGYNDLIATARFDYYVKGKVYVYLGGKEMDSELDIYIEGENNDHIGMAISYLGDLNNDFFDDFAVSGYRGEGYNAPVPSFTVFWGDKDISKVGWENSEQFIIDGERPIKGITGLNDINNDGNLDFAVINTDSLFVFSYDNSEKEFEIISVGSDPEQQGFQSLSNSGDINNDGFNDLIVGLGRWPTLPRGAVQIFYGEEDFDFTYNNLLITADTNSSFGEGKVAFVNNLLDSNKNCIAVGISSIETGLSEFDHRGYVDVYANNITTTDIQKGNNSIKNFRLFENYPNPFNPTTTIEYSIPEADVQNLVSQQLVQLKVYNILGKEFETLVNKEQRPGKYKVQFDGKNLPSGIYLITLTAGKYRKTIKTILLK